MGTPRGEEILCGNLSTAEAVRQVLHMGVGVLALALVFLGPWGGVALAASLLIFNLWIFPRFGGRRLWRLDELARGLRTTIFVRNAGKFAGSLI